MNEKQQQLLFDKGITNVPSDALCSDNALEESLGMVYDNGEHRVIQKPVTVKGLEARYDIIFVHTYNDEKRYIYVSSNDLLWKNANSIGLTLMHFEGKPQVTSIGKTLIVSDGSGLHYFSWTNDSYKPLRLQLPDLSFQAHVYDTTTYSEVYSSGNAEGILGTVVKEGGAQELDVLNGQRDAYNNLVAGLYAKNLKGIAEEKGFAEPFFVRAALELYDGSYTHITNPILLFPSVTKNSYARTYLKNLVLYTHYCKLMVRQNTSYENYSDLVKDVVIFVSKGVSIHNLSVDQPFVLMTTEEKGKVGDYVAVTSDIGMPRSKFGNYQVHETTRPAFSCLKNRKDNDIKEDIQNVSVFYKLCSLGLKSTSGFVDVSSLITDKTIENLTTQEQLKYDDYFSRSNLKAKNVFTYNNRLNLANVQRGMFGGFGYFMPLDDDSDGQSYVFYVKIKTDTEEIWVSHTEMTSFQKQGIYFYYPDSRATHVKIFRYRNNFASCVLDADLTEHQGLNGAYYFRELPNSSSVGEVTVTGVAPQNLNNNYYESFPNRIITSEVNNPFVFLAEGYNDIGIGSIIGAASATQALSQGQFGQYPLLVFSTDGIWAMSVSNNGLFQTIRPMSREIALDTSPITQTDGAVFFVSKKGLMVVDGAQVRCVSPQMSGKTQSSDFQKAYLGNFLDYLSYCMIAYDYRDSLLWIMNPSYNHCYVYSIKSGTFGKFNLGTYKVDGQDHPVLPFYVVNDYPDYLICTNTSVLSLLNRPNINNDPEDYSGTLISRPMKLENAFALKSIMHINHACALSDSASITMQIYASNNLKNWKELHSLRGTPWLYYRFRYNFDYMKATDRFAGSLVVTQERRTDKPRTYYDVDNYKYSITSEYMTTYGGVIEIPQDQQSATVLLDANFWRKVGTSAEESVSCHWVMWKMMSGGGVVEIAHGEGNSMSQSVEATTAISSIVIGINKKVAPSSPASTQAAITFGVNKIPDTPAEYTYSIDTNISSIVIPYGNTSVENQVSAYGMRTAGGITEGFACYIKIWKLTGGVYTKITGLDTPAYGCGAIDVFNSSDTSVVAAISNTEMSDTYGADTYLATSSIPISVSQTPTPAPDPDPYGPDTPTPTPSGDDVAVTITLNNASQNTLTIENIIKFGFSNGERMDIRLSSTSPVYVQAGASKTFGATALNGNTFYGLTFASDAVCQQQDWNNNVFIYDLNHVSDNYGMDALSSTDKFEKNRTYNLKCNTSPEEQPQPTPTPPGSNPVITIGVNITNNTGSTITLDGRLRFVLGNPDHNGNYFGGYQGTYIRTDNIYFSSSAVTIAPGETQSYSGLTWRDADTGCGLGETSPLNPSLLPILDDQGGIAYARNILIYTNGRSDVTLCDNLDPSTIFQEGGVYNISITSA